MDPLLGRTRWISPLWQAADTALAWARWVGPGVRLPHRILVTSLPKAGTNLVRKALERLPGTVTLRAALFRETAPRPRGGLAQVPIGVDWPVSADAARVRRRLRWVPPGGVLSGHIPHSPGFASIVAQLDVRVVAVVRDPRAVAASLVPFVLERPHHFLHDRFAALAPEERLVASLTGLPADERGLGLLDLGTRFGSIAAWREDPNAIVVRFEDLVGSAGGGSDERRLEVLGRLAVHVSSPHDERVLATVADGLFGGTSTFRRGSVDAWRADFRTEDHDLARATLGGVGASLGYDLGP
ncbi:MAG: hypothetical protein KY469_01930 [Actinobacteria bacterium]|nr:hypothetical protein [Actinomycetota bacterium]